MKLKPTLILALIAMSITGAQAAAPANDSILKAIKLSGNYSASAEQDLTLATADAMDPLISNASAGKTLWFVLPYFPASETVTFTVTSSTAVGSATAFEVQDPGNPRGSLHQATVPITLAAGQTTTMSVNYSGKPVYLMLAGTGKCRVTHRIAGGWDNDFPVNARVVSGSSGSYGTNNLSATNTAQTNPTCPLEPPP